MSRSQATCSYGTREVGENGSRLLSSFQRVKSIDRMVTPPIPAQAGRAASQYYNYASAASLDCGSSFLSEKELKSAFAEAYILSHLAD